MFAVGLIGGVISAAGAIMQAGAASSAAKYNAAVAENNAGIARGEAELEAQDKRKEMRRALGMIRAQYGASGIEFAGGSGLDVLADSATEYAWDETKIRYKGEAKAVGFEAQAELDKMQASAATTTGFIGAATGLLGGVSSAMKYAPTSFGQDLATA